MRIDARVPMVFGPVSAQEADHVLVEGIDFEVSPAEHVPGCACCAPREAVASVLGSLFFARARGTVPFFRRLVVHATTPEGESAVRAAQTSDPVVSGCYRLM